MLVAREVAWHLSATVSYCANSLSQLRLRVARIYSILCPLGPGALNGSKKVMRITVLFEKEPVSSSFVRPN